MRLAVGDLRSEIQDDQPLAEHLHELHVVVDDADADPVLGKLLDETDKRCRFSIIEAGRGLIEQNKGGSCGKSQGDTEKT